MYTAHNIHIQVACGLGLTVAFNASSTNIIYVRILNFVMSSTHNNPDMQLQYVYTNNIIYVELPMLVFSLTGSTPLYI